MVETTPNLEFFEEFSNCFWWVGIFNFLWWVGIFNFFMAGGNFQFFYGWEFSKCFWWVGSSYQWYQWYQATSAQNHNHIHVIPSGSTWNLLIIFKVFLRTGQCSWLIIHPISRHLLPVLLETSATCYTPIATSVAQFISGCGHGCHKDPCSATFNITNNCH